jgi:hypothetical protein
LARWTPSNFLVFAVLIFVGVIIVVSMGKLPGQLARKWRHPQAGAINAIHPAPRN